MYYDTRFLLFLSYCYSSFLFDRLVPIASVFLFLEVFFYYWHFFYLCSLVHIFFIIEISFLCILKPLLVVEISQIFETIVVLFLPQEFLSMHLRLLFFALLYIFLYPYYIFCGLHIQFFFFPGIFLLSKLKSSLIRLRRKFPKAQSHNGKLYSSNISSKRNPET